MQHGDLAAELLDEAHVVLDHHQRVLARQRQEQLGGALGFLVGHAGHRLVEQQQLGVLHQQHADLQPLLLAVREQAGRALGFACRGGSGVRISAMRSRCVAGQPANRLVAHALVGLQRQFEVLEHA